MTRLPAWTLAAALLTLLRPAAAQAPGFPFVLSADETGRTPTDVAFLNDVPAGRHGPIEVRDGRFVEGATGRRIRFFGLCLETLPERDEAERMAARFARFGVNLVRLSPGEGGEGEEDRLDPEGLERLDHLVARLKQRGIYIVLPEPLARALRVRVNPETRTVYAEEPAIVSVRASEYGVGELSLTAEARPLSGQEADSPLPALIRARSADRPFVVHLTAPSPDHRFAVEAVPLLAATAALQDWDGIWIDEPAAAPFDPGRWAFFPSAAWLFRSAAFAPTARDSEGVRRPLFTASSARAKAVAGFVTDREIALGDARFFFGGEVPGGFAALTLAALDGQPVAESRKLLLTVASRVVAGSAQVPTVAVTLRVSGRRQVIALDAGGGWMAKVPVSLEHGYLRFTLAPADRALWYAVVP